MKNILLVAVGFLMLAIGAVGLFLPILPTTPFVLVATACFATSPSLHARVMKIPFVNEYISNYREGKGISRKTVVCSLVFLWAMLIISAIVVKISWVVIVLAAIGAMVTIHILAVSKPRKQRKDSNIAENLSDEGD